MKTYLNLCAAAVVVASTTTALTAQANQITAIEEIVVTATKRAQSAQDVPIAINAITSDALERNGINDISDLNIVAPTFQMNTSQTESQGTALRIRGVGTLGNNIGLESSVGVFIDGVYMSRPGGVLGDLMDLEAIEVLRGPQGTLFGRNTSAGALNIRTKTPNTQENEYFTNITAGNLGSFNIQAGASGPINDELSYRIAGAYRERDGILDSTTGAESGNKDRVLVRGQLLWEPNEDLSIRFLGDYSSTEEQCCDGVIIEDTPAVAAGSFAASGLPADGGVQASGFSALESRTSAAEQFENPIDHWGVSVEVNWDINDDVAMTYIGAYRDFWSLRVEQSDFVNLDVWTVDADFAGGLDTEDEIKTQTHELRFSGQNKWVDWMVGAYYSDEEIREPFALAILDDYTENTDATLWRAAFQPLLGAASSLANAPLATGGTFGDVLNAASPTAAFAGGIEGAGAYAHNRYAQDAKSWSIFTHNIFHVNDRLDVVLGLRYTEEDKDGSYTQTGLNGEEYCLNTAANAGALASAAAGTGLEEVAGTIGGFSVGFACLSFIAPADTGLPFLPSSFNETFEDEELTYTGKIVYDFTDTIIGYIGYTHGFKSGGFNLDSTATANGLDPRFSSELVDNLEAGIKAEFFDSRLRANFSIYDYDIENFQVLEFTGAQFQTFNVPNAENKGFEIELTAVPAAGFLLNLAYAYSDANYTTDCDGGDPNAFPLVQGLCGNQFTNAPENVFVGGLAYNGQLTENLNWFASSTVRWEDERRTATLPTVPLEIQDSNTKVGLRFGVGSNDGKWQMEFWGNNITDERTRNITFNVPVRPGATAAFIDPPRTYGVTLRTNW